MSAPYVGRFAPSPTGPLHAGSLVAALASWLDARAHGGRWLVRIEDVDTQRCHPDLGAHQLAQLARCGLESDAPVLWQSTRSAAYQSALEDLMARELAYPCGCSRSAVAQHLHAQGGTRTRHTELVYPGTCRSGMHGRSVRSWRLHTPRCIAYCMESQPARQAQQAQDAITFVSPESVHWSDRRLGAQQQCLVSEVGDFVLRRGDGGYAYQLAVVVDDAAQGITHVVRGADLADNTARQIVLQRALGLPTPQYLHTPLVLDAHGEKLSKQTGATAIDDAAPLQALNVAAAVLGLAAQCDSVAQALQAWTAQWPWRAPLYNAPP